MGVAILGHAVAGASAALPLDGAAEAGAAEEHPLEHQEDRRWG